MPEGAVIAARFDVPRNYLGHLLKTIADDALPPPRKGQGGEIRLAPTPPRGILNSGSCDALIGGSVEWLAL